MEGGTRRWEEGGTEGRMRGLRGGREEEGGPEVRGQESKASSTNARVNGWHFCGICFRDVDSICEDLYKAAVLLLKNKIREQNKEKACDDLLPPSGICQSKPYPSQSVARNRPGQGRKARRAARLPLHSSGHPVTRLRSSLPKAPQRRLSQRY